jgi:hypothetical protein
MAAEQTQTQQTAEVEATNERGIKLAGRWFNFSQFHQVPRPEVGQLVRVTLQKGRFISGLKILTPGDLDDGEGEADPTDEAFPEFEGPPPPAPAGFRVAPGLDGPPAGDYPAGSAAPRRVTGEVGPAPTPPPAPRAPSAARTPALPSLKAAALAAAAHFLSGKPDSTEDAVYQTAFRFLAWLEDDEA